MMMSLFYLAAIIWCYVSAYVVSVYAAAIYIDPEELSRRFPGLSQRRRQALVRLVSDPRAFLQVATIYRYFALIAIVVCTILLTDEIVGRHSGYVAWFNLLMVWVLFVLVAEFLPRRASRRAVRRGIVGWLWLIGLLRWLLHPVVTAYRRGLRGGGVERHVTEDEKEEIVERAIETLAEQAGIGETIVEADEKEMIGQIFRLDQTTVEEIMSPRIDLVGIEKSTRFADIQDLVRRDGHSRYPVYEGTIDKIIGILYVKDLFNNLPRPGEEFVITDYLRRPYFVPETKVIGDLLREFRSRKLHVAVVVDDYGGVSGLVTLEDILEEIVGEIQDEHDTEDEDIRRQSDGSLVVDANLRLEKLQELLETEYPQDENATVGGLIYDLVGSVPTINQEVAWHSLRLRVLGLDGQRILSVRVKPFQPTP
ncbi:MAG: hemolysin family protein [Candidatus Zixiibacteriota bacterium]